MSSWKEVPHLFANGRFQAMVSDVVLNIEGIGRVNGFNSFAYLLEKDNTAVREAVDSCILIARPISDLSDEEATEMFGYELDRYGIAASRGHLNDIVYNARLYGAKSQVSTFRTLQLLELGVYPFDQSHFETGEVIARYEKGGSDAS
ncbi:MAG: hypothetical protein CL666_14565 [Balneola sp.]|nr:hypothetical protein [Balneola sp.]|tara:strand:+ start:55876 stop:56316 length:441 start_codon:yes stop_codon:yes gene_type:complete